MVYSTNLGLRMLYGLVNKTIDGIPPLLGCLNKYIKTEGLDTMRNNAENVVNVSFHLHYIIQ
jgi:hypothetical protein